VQPQPQEGVGLVGVGDEFLELVENVPVEEVEVGAIDVEGVVRARSRRR
jgi:hypothetical protein